MKKYLFLLLSFVALAAWAPAPAAPRDFPPCNEDCKEEMDSEGHHLGNSCIQGSFGYWCVATTSACAIQNEGCVYDPGGGGDFPAELAASTRAWRQIEGQDGRAYLARLTCDPGTTR